MVGPESLSAISGSAIYLRNGKACSSDTPCPVPVSGLKKFYAQVYVYATRCASIESRTQRGLLAVFPRFESIR